jgi:hypothetical protein
LVLICSPDAEPCDVIGATILQEQVRLPPGVTQTVKTQLAVR